MDTKHGDLTLNSPRIHSFIGTYYCSQKGFQANYALSSTFPKNNTMFPKNNRLFKIANLIFILAFFARFGQF